jgi:RNA polymerase sigma-54 factor
MTFELAMVPRFGFEVTPALVTFGEMLMLPYAEMRCAVEDELGSNTALERVDSGECPLCRGRWRARCDACSPVSGRSGIPDPGVMDGGSDARALIQAVCLETTASDRQLVEYVVGNLDQHGLLDRTSAELAADGGVPEVAVERVLAVVRRCGAPGVGATGVGECLLLQLDALGLDDRCTRLARQVIAEHLQALARGRFAAIATALGVSRTDVRGVLGLIKEKLRPYPAYDGVAPATTSYVVPDLVIREDSTGEFTVELVEPAVTRLRVRPTTPTDGSVEAVQRARSFVAQLRDRWETLRRVAEYAVHRQRQYLREGTARLEPLTRAEVAAALELHESTVSRAVADKFALLPDQSVVPLARFFGSGGGVDHTLRALLAAANGPMSDQQLADLMRAEGYPLARRTIAKHRARLGFAAAALR